MSFGSDISKMMLAARPSPAGRLGGGGTGGGQVVVGGGSSSNATTSSSGGSLLSRVVQAGKTPGGMTGSNVGMAGRRSDVVGSSSVLSASFSRATSRTIVVGSVGSAASQVVVGGGSSAGGGVQTPQSMIVTFRGQATPVGFLINKLVELLKGAGRSLHVKEVEKALIQMGFTGVHTFFEPTSEFLKLLSSNERVAYNARGRTLAFHNPYQSITSSEALLAKIQYDGALTGMKVEPELLTAHPEMTTWINSLLASRKVRGIRVNNNHLRGKQKCAAIGSGNTSGTVCDIYASRKCSNCRQNLAGLLLYPLGEDLYEKARMELDAEVKALWDSIELPPLEDIIKECDPSRSIMRQNAEAAANEKAQLKKRAEAKRVSRYRSKFRRIQNTHLFTAEELRAFANEHNNSASASSSNAH